MRLKSAAEIEAIARAGEIVAGHQAPGGINGWPAVVGDTVLWPVGMADPEPALVAYRLPDAG